MSILAHRPFPAPQPDAAIGPIFFCAEECLRREAAGLPPVLANRPRHLIKGYGADDRIACGTGRILALDDIAEVAKLLFDDPRVGYGHVHSTSDNCQTRRIDPAQ